MKLKDLIRSAVISMTVATLVFASSGCSTIYYNIQEKLGNEKREILVSRVDKAQNEQEEAKEEFQSAFEEFSALVSFDGGKLEKNYKRLNGAYERSKSKADAVSERIDSIEDVAGALFREWENELNEYSNADLRRASERQLVATRQRYQTLISAMTRAEAKMAPVLAAFHDQVLFLKHNLNAQAIASLQTEVDVLESTVADLIAEMNDSIEEANRFISQMEGV